MTLTTEEMRDIVAMCIRRYLVEERGGIASVDEAVNLVKWVDTRDFEFILEVLRED